MEHLGWWSSWLPSPPVILVGCIIVVTLFYAMATLIYPLIYPTVVTYPWELHNRPNTNHPTVVCIAGSFAPPHKGHVALLQYLATRYQTVYVVIGWNPQKQYAVTPAQRADMVQQCCAPWPNVTVQVVSGYIWRWAKPAGVNAFVRGIRTWEMDGAAERYLAFQNTWGPLALGPFWWPLPTLFLEGHPAYRHVSSTLIRNLCSAQQQLTPQLRAELQTLVPAVIVNQVWECYRPK